MRIVTNSEMVSRYLSGHHEVLLVKSEEIASDWYDPAQFELIVVDIDATQGVYTSRAIHKENPEIPIIGVSEDLPYDGEWPEQRAIFIEQGGCYLLQAPINPREMLACIGAIDRKQRKVLPTVRLFHGRLVIKPVDMAVFFDERLVEFTAYETKTLIALAAFFGKFVNRIDLMKMLYSHDFEQHETNTLEVFIVRIRRRLKALHPDLDRCVKTVRGLGYQLVDLESD